MYVSLTEDVVPLNNYLNQEAKAKSLLLNATKDIEDSYCKLTEILLVQVILFNRKRSGEAQRIKIEDISSGLHTIG
jgi:hypothetical protein